MADSDSAKGASGILDGNSIFTMDLAVSFLSGETPYSMELQAFWMAVQGAMMVRMGPNKGKKLHWFHSFCLSVIAGYGGGWMGFVWMGLPSSMLSNDVNMASCIIAFYLVNYSPFDVGFKVLSTLPFQIITVSFAQLFRSLGIMKFCNVCFEAFKDSPSDYYPIPVFGPIMYATLLGNMGSFLLKGFEGHIENGMPWAFQNGLFIGSFYHFYVHDLTGPIGIFLRSYLVLPSLLLGLDDTTFAIAMTSLWMQVMGILQIPAFLGPSFSPFGVSILNPFKDSTSWAVGKHESAWSTKKKKKMAKSKKTN